MRYIILDLEWNQSNTGAEAEAAELPFEIIEIGAIKLNGEGIILGEFSELIKPVVYHEMHHITSKLIHMQMRELERGKPFPEVMSRFLDWCGQEEYLFCTWGCSDLTELQRNIKFHNMTPLSDKPIRYLDVQKLFSIAYEDRKTRRALEFAVDHMGIEKDIPFHRAFSDAYYTAKVFSGLMQEDAAVLRNESYDVFHPPLRREDEVKVQFDTYEKYISRKFASREEAFADKEVISSKCYICHRNLRKRIKWFTANGRNYYCLAYCEKHGFLKGKIRVRKADDDSVYIVKTTKFITQEAAEDISRRQAKAKELRRHHRHKEA